MAMTSSPLKLVHSIVLVNSIVHHCIHRSYTHLEKTQQVGDSAGRVGGEGVSSSLHPTKHIKAKNLPCLVLSFH